MIIKKNFYAILCLIVFVLSIICSCKTQSKQINQPKIKLTEVSVFDYSELAGCGFVFKLADETFLIPVTMPDSLKHADIKLRIAFTEKQMANICMTGKIIELNYAEYIK